jgi:hypothetical protein
MGGRPYSAKGKSMPLRTVPRERPAAAITGCSPSVTTTFRVGSRAYFERRDTPWLLGWAAEKVAGGVGVGHRVGVVDVEDQGKVERIGAGGQGFLQDAVPPDVFERDAARLVLVEVVGGGTGLVPRALMRESSTCRLAVSGQVARRYPSQASRR